MGPLLDIQDLHVRFETPDGTVDAVAGASLSVDRGEIVGLVGESGSGKSVTARSILGLHSPGRVTGGTISYDGTALTALSEKRHRQYRGSELSMVFQDPTTTLNPVFDVGEQIAESLRLHDDQSQSLLDYLHLSPFTDRSAWARHRERAIELMEQVGISDPDDRVDAYPHELSGGMCQRAMIAIALAADPNLLIVDEPTTALDTTTQARILDRLRSLATETDTAILLISHHIGVVDEVCDRVVVMYGGQVMERGPVDRVVGSPEHPYTKGLVNCRITADSRHPLPTIPGSVPDRIPDTGCPFASRCEYATAACQEAKPPEVPVDADHAVSCGELDAVRAAGSAARTVTDGAASQRPDDSTRGLPRYDGGRHEGTVASQSAVAEEAVDTGTADEDATSVFETRSVTKTFELSSSVFDRWLDDRQTLTAVDSVDLSVSRGETVGVVGESGSGKSTLVNLLTGLCEPTAGEVVFDGKPVGAIADRTADQLRDVGVVFQNPRDSINPRLTVREAIAEPLVEQDWPQSKRTHRVDELIELVDLPPQYASRRPHQLSGGQLQRVAIARAIALEPQVVVFDEPLSALDLSTTAQLLNLLTTLQNRLDLTYVIVSHDLGVVQHIADCVLVMYLGEIVERGPADLVFERPSHPYTATLVDAATDGRGDGLTVEGPPPSAVEMPSGCRFHTRCPLTEPECQSEEPAVEPVGDAFSRCHFAREFVDDQQ
jgi:peptide/nickel transport system ATP-binding protein